METLSRNTAVSRNWKELERHPLSAVYPDLKGQAWKDFKQSVNEGLRDHHFVTIYQGRVLDGWQLQRACVELDVKPKYVQFPEDGDAEAFVGAVNDHRRHESQEKATERIEERRRRVAEARVNGQSIPTIAEAEGVSETTVRNDIEAATSQGCEVEPPDGKITGKDGKKRDASPKATITQSGRKRTLKNETDGNGTLVDSVEQAVPPGLVTVFNKVKEFKGIINQLNEINRTLGELHKIAAGGALDLQAAQLDLRNLKESVHFSVPYAVCPMCEGLPKNRKPNCACKGRGWLVETSYKKLPSEYRK